MAKFEGTVERSDLEGGAWLLRTAEGTIYQLHGGPEDLYREGASVEIEGEIARQMLSFVMMGPILEVRGYRGLP